MRASEVMHTPAVICAPGTTLRETAQLMERRRVGSVIVIDEVVEVAGIVTDRDIVLRGVALGRSAGAPVDTVMTRNVATVDVHADVAEGRGDDDEAGSASASGHRRDGSCPRPGGARRPRPPRRQRGGHGGELVARQSATSSFEE